MLTTMSLPTSGTGRVAGHDIREDPDAVRRSMGLTGQNATVDEFLTGRENIRLIGSFAGLGRADVRRIGDELLERFSLTDAADRTVKTYSGGMRRRLDLAVSLVATPPVLFLDEPTTGLDPRSRTELWEVLRGLVADGTTLVLTTQYLEEADQLANEIIVVDKGRIIAQGTANQLKDGAGRASVVVHVTHASDLAAVEEVARRGSEEVHVDAHARRVSAKARGLADMLAIGSALEATGIAIDDIGLSRPTLDDVFLHLTGHRAEQLDEGTAPEERAEEEVASR
jgi:ABC-2 type transport system ATP-binding protein